MINACVNHNVRALGKYHYTYIIEKISHQNVNIENSYTYKGIYYSFFSVFTSTVNVVFQGREIIDGNEKSHLWVEDGQYLDYYSKTKEQAEKMVIESNCKKTKNGKNDLRTCVLRYSK